MTAVPWSRETGLEAVVNKWLARGVVRDDIVADEERASSSGHYAEIPAGLPAPLRAALAQRGIGSLYAHQVDAFRAATSGKHVVVATPTASGKSLCFHLPVLTALLENPRARAMYLFPTKALARDQEASLRALMQEAGVFQKGVGGAVVYDGDTPGDARRAAREKSGIVLTNPDMLHAGILPHHAAWSATFQQLKYVVLDELHTYKGVFGSHLANVIRRLRRVCRFHGSDPIFVCATATIGNPREHAARLLGLDPEEIVLLDQSGAPRGTRRVLVYNPPVVNAELGIRGSCPKRAVRFTADLLKARVPTILFGASRNGVETMLKYLREATAGHVPPDAIMGYRGGYLADQRRKIEEGLRKGDILGVVATNALELGVDIGELDAVVCAGYPGSIAATWQRFGRAGRRGAPSIALLVASSAAVDQYLAREPSYLLGSPVEEARIDPNNVEILVQHIKCAAFEAPFEDGEGFGDLGADSTRDALLWLADSGLVHEVRAGGKARFHWASDVYPANHVPLRSVSWDNVVIVEQRAELQDRTIAELDWRAAQTMLHEQAIYQQDGAQYQVERFDFENHKAYIRLVDPDYYTEAMTYVKVAVLEEAARGTTGDAVLAHGEVQVVEKVVGYKKIKFHTHENCGYGDVRLPDLELHTTSCWVTLPESLVAALAEQGLGRSGVVDALRGVGRALETVATIALMCDPRDLAMVVEDKATAQEDAAFTPTLHLYDAYPGGIGLSPRVHSMFAALLARARGLVSGCTCEGGCPGCVGPSVDPGSRRKNHALMLFDHLAAETMH
ncbi:MAG: DEAD/DEAH box helicase [Myxococcales bacterium]|nr:DEAD/DEAH box helicase [Myxococcales bacterium]